MWLRDGFLTLAVAVVSVALNAASADLRLRTAEQTHTLRSVEGAEHPLYSLEELASVLNLRLEPQGTALIVEGARGSVRLERDRPLARVDEEYVLLSAAVREASGRWYVPEDFITKAASLLVDQKIEEKGGGVFDVGVFTMNPVGVRVLNYPDHVSIVFAPRLKSPIQVRERRQFIEVSFGEYRVRPQQEWDSPEQGIVSGIRFRSMDQFGTFEIIKGKEYDSYRQYELGEPFRWVVDVYRSPLDTVTIPDARAAPHPDRPPEEFDSGRDSSGPMPDRAPRFERVVGSNIVTIDPGHGGDNYGVHPTQDLLEKNFNLLISQSIFGQFQATPLRAELTRGRDIAISVDQRSAIGNMNRSKAFVSIHVGGSPDPTVQGAVVYIHRFAGAPSRSGAFTPWVEGQRPYLSRSRELATRIQMRLNALFGVENGVQEAPLAVLAPVMAPAVMVEAGFLTNPEDRERLLDPEFRQHLGEEIARGLREFLQ